MDSMEEIVTPHSMLAVGVIMPLVAGLMVGTRMWMRWSTSTRLLEHDYLILAAYTILLATSIMFIWGGASQTLASRIPTGNSPTAFMFVVTPKLVATEKMKFAYNLMVNPALGFVKLSVLTWYRRIFRGRIFNAVTITMIVIISMWIVATWFAFFFQCGTNFGAFWSDLHDLLTKCNKYARYYNQVLAIPDFITDVLIVSIPIPMIWHLKMETAKKIGLCFVFLLGAFASGAALTRLLVYQKSLTNRFTNAQGILVISIWMFWSHIELGVSITAACLPIMASLLRTEVFKKFSSSLRNLSSNIPSLHKLRNSPQRSDTENSKLSRGSEVSDSDDTLYHGSVGRVRTSVTASKMDLEKGNEYDNIIEKPGTILARTDISQSYVERKDLPRG